MELIQND